MYETDPHLISSLTLVWQCGAAALHSGAFKHLSMFSLVYFS